MPHTSRWSIPRRTFLRGAGVAVALPWLEAMGSPVKAAELTTPADALEAGKYAPVRFGCLFFPNGVWKDAWIPKQSGKDFELPDSLQPLTNLKEHVTILSQLDKRHSHEGDGHYAKTANFLTGLRVEKTTGKNISTGGVSLDQYMARQVGHLTPFPSLELGIDPVISGIDSNVGYTRLYGSHISWQTAERPVAKEINPRTVFDRLMNVQQAGKNRGQAASSRDADRKSLLDFAMSDARRLRQQLGRDDQFKLDEYLDSVRAVEKRIEFFTQPDPRVWHPETPQAEMEAPGAPRDYQEHVRLMIDLMILAFQTDSTRVSSFMFANDVSGHNFSFVDGVRGSHHELSHHEGKPEKIEQYQKINRWHVSQFSRMLERMSQIREGESTLLDNSMILLGCGMADGNAHQPDNLPIVVGGHAGGRFAGGQHIASAPRTPLCNLYVSMLDGMGCPVNQFGDSTGPIKEVFLS